MLERKYGARTIKIVPTENAEEIQTWGVQIRQGKIEEAESKESKESNCFTIKGLHQVEFPFQLEMWPLTRVQ